MNMRPEQKALLQEAMAEAIAYYIHKEPVLEMMLAKIADIQELDSLNAELLADVFNFVEVDVGTLMSAHMKSKQTQSVIHMNHDLARRRMDRVDEHGC